ncbi:MAG: glycosyltransferase [Gammaproteobacteria bacterium]|nr:glycosyltransferase [Gammaproteobacteria bacterium]MBU1408498.1 glycosyltransferase [Gammaproteobacteria bacterium]MBU1532310.1 glycosyltransferase [Gammaproteobacteria bacterium]
MGRIVLLDSQKNLPVGFSRPLVDVLGALGWQVCLAQEESDLVAGDTLLVLGLANWALASRPFLMRAGELGVKRILWSCEPLLPPDLPQSRLQDWFLQAHALDYSRRPRWMQRVFDRIAYCGFTIQSWSLPWNRERKFPVRQFSYAAKESRRLLGFWREGLIDSVFVSLRPRQGFLANHGIPSLFVPIGYHPIWGRSLEAGERDIDVVFLGNVTRRRRPLLQELDHALAKAGFKLKIVSGNCFGEERTQLLNRSKVLLNLNSLPWESPGMRMLMAMSCKAMVVSEYAEDIAPYINGQHLMLAAGKDLAGLVISCLGDEALRSKIADQAYRFVMEEHTLAARLTAALESQAMATKPFI